MYIYENNLLPLYYTDFIHLLLIIYLIQCVLHLLFISDIFPGSLCDNDIPPHLLKLSDEDNTDFVTTVEELKAAEVCE